MNATTNKPASQLRLGNVKIAIWANVTEQGTFYSVQPTRTYRDEKGYHDSTSFSGDEILRLAHLLHKAYDQIASLRAETADEAPAEQAK